MGDVPQRISNTGLLTGISLALIAAFAVLVVIGILWGARLKRQRTVAEQEEETRVDADAQPKPPTSDSPAAESVRDGRAAPVAEGEGYERSPATASARPEAVATPSEQQDGSEAGTPTPSAIKAEPQVTPREENDAATALSRNEASSPRTSAASAAQPDAAPPASNSAPAATAPQPNTGAALTGQGGEVPATDGAVTLLKGLGPKVAARLAELGITTVGQLAALDAGEADRLDAQLGAFAGRLSRDRWVEQARFLAAGDKKGFEAVFGRL